MYPFASEGKNTTGWGFNNRNALSPSLGGWQCKMAVSANLVSPEASLIGL